MGKKYHHVFICPEGGGADDWTHEFSADNRPDANDEKRSCENQGYRVRIVLSAEPVESLLAKVRESARVDAKQVNAARALKLTERELGARFWLWAPFATAAIEAMQLGQINTIKANATARLIADEVCALCDDGPQTAHSALSHIPALHRLWLDAAEAELEDFYSVMDDELNEV